jgi:hypothetical protein
MAYVAQFATLCCDLRYAQLAEIDENLVRADLSPAENALHIAKRKEIYERIHPETKQGSTPGSHTMSGGRYGRRQSEDAKLASSPSFVRATAEALALAEVSSVANLATL